MNREAAVIQAGNHALAGEMIGPDAPAEPMPTVICCNGLGDNMAKCENNFAAPLAAKGIASFCFDFYGGSADSQSGGDMREMSVFTEMEDLRHVISSLLKNPKVDPEQIFLMGESQGGFVAAAVAPEYADSIRGLILYYPGFCIPDMAVLDYGSPEGVPEHFTLLGQELGPAYYRDVFGYPIYHVIAGYHGPVLLFQGDSDLVVDPSYSRRAAKVYDHAKLVTFPWEGHGFSSLGIRRAAELSSHFVLENRNKVNSGSD